MNNRLKAACRTFQKTAYLLHQIAIDTELLKKQQHTKKSLQLMNEGSEPARSAFEKKKG
jgi:septation ring formation regulator EzrA